MRVNSIGLFLVILIASTVILSWSSYLLIKEILRYSDSPSIDFYSVDPKTFPKVLLIGNSRAGSNFSDSAFAPGDFLNLGVGGAKFDLLSREAMDMIALNPKLNFVVVETYFLPNAGGVGRRGYIEALFSDRIKEYTWKSFSDFEKFTITLFPSYWLNAPNFFDALVGVFIDRPKRQIANSARFNSKRLGEVSIARIKGKTYPSISQNVIQELIDLRKTCEKSGVTLLMVTAPIYQLHWKSVGWRNHLSDVKKISTNLGIRFIDFSETLSGDIKFIDTVHLNSSGADFMSEVLFHETLGNEDSH